MWGCCATVYREHAREKWGVGVVMRCDATQEKRAHSESGESVFFQKFLETRQILLSGEISKDLAEGIVRQLFVLESLSVSKPIYMYVDSPGGDVDAGYAIFDVIRFVKTPVYTNGMGLVASAGVLVLLAAKKDCRFGLRNSRYLIHQPLSGMRGVATDIEIHARELEKTRSKLNALIASETGVSLDKVAQDTNRDYWLDASQALEYGLISNLIEKRADLPKK